MFKKKFFPRHTLNIDRSIFALACKRFFKQEEDAVRQFEKKFSNYIGTEYAIGVGSARKGFYLSLKSLGLNENDEVIMPSYTFHALPTAVIACGLKPVFIDANPKTYNIDSSLIEQNISERTRVIVVTHVFGQPCDMARIRELAKKYKLFVIEDCAHACGAKYGDKRAGALGDIAVFSFKMGKNLPCFGGGMITINKKDIFVNIEKDVRNFFPPKKRDIWGEIINTFICYLATKRIVFRYFTYPLIHFLSILGSDWVDRHIQEEINMAEDLKTLHNQTRLSSLQASIGIRQLTNLEKVNERRRINAEKLSEELRKSECVSISDVIADTVPTYLYFRIRVPDPKRFKRKLLSRGVDTKLDDMSACSNLEDFAKFKKECPQAEELTKEILGIPVNQYLNDEDIAYIARQIECVSNEVSQGREP